jgi:Domain of unknown function (DUF362)
MRSHAPSRHVTDPVPVTQVATESFIYQPPIAAVGAQRILVKPNLGYPVAAPVTVSLGVLGEVLRALRATSPQAEILIVEGVCSPASLAEIAAKHGVYSLLDEGMRLVDADTLPIVEYGNLSPQPVRFKTMWAPELLREVDCRISVGAFKRTMLKNEALISASLKNLYGLFPRTQYKARSPHSRGQLHRPSVPLVLQDVYFSIGHLFDGAVVDADQRLVSRDWKPDRGKSIAFGQVFFGEDLVKVDKTACKAAAEQMPSYLQAIDKLRQKQPG